MERKIVLYGDKEVGKTALARQFLKGTWEDDYQPTIEDIHHKRIFIEEQSFDVVIMDTSGQKEYQVLADQHIRPGHGYLLLYDMTDQDTLKSLGQYILMLRDKLDSDSYNDRAFIPISVVGTKSDLKDKISTTEETARSYILEEFSDLLEENSNQNQYSTGDTIKDVRAGLYRITFYTTSAKQGDQVEKVFKDTVQGLNQSEKEKEIEKKNNESKSRKNDNKSLTSQFFSSQSTRQLRPKEYDDMFSKLDGLDDI